jgi:hypothetical protein
VYDFAVGIIGAGHVDIEYSSTKSQWVWCKNATPPQLCTQRPQISIAPQNNFRYSFILSACLTLSPTTSSQTAPPSTLSHYFLLYLRSLLHTPYPSCCFPSLHVKLTTHRPPSTAVTCLLPLQSVDKDNITWVIFLCISSLIRCANHHKTASTNYRRSALKFPSSCCMRSHTETGLTLMMTRLVEYTISVFHWY